MNAMVDPASSPDAPGSPVKVTRQRGGLEHASGIFAALEAMAKSTADYGPNTSEKIAQESVSDPIPSPIPEVEPTTGTELTEEAHDSVGRDGPGADPRRAAHGT